MNIFWAIERDKNLTILRILDFGETVDGAIGNEGNEDTFILELVD